MDQSSHQIAHITIHINGFMNVSDPPFMVLGFAIIPSYKHCKYCKIVEAIQMF